MTAIKWLKELNQTILTTDCKVSNQPSSLDEANKAMAELFADIRSNNATVWWIGNGGSVSIGSHLYQDLINKLKIRSQLLAESSLITCMTNDYGYSEVYRRPLELMASPGDLLIAISSSGQSENILQCAELCKDKEMKLVTLSGFAEDNPLWSSEADISFKVNSNLYGHVEVAHMALLHAVIENQWLEEQLT
jgi:D-sedoheptulose 7-phosphate isomerase